MSPAPDHPGDGSPDSEPQLGQALRGKCHELGTLILLANAPEEAAAYVLAYLPHHLAGVFDQVRSPSLCALKAGYQGAGQDRHAPDGARQDRWHHIDPA